MIIHTFDSPKDMSTEAKQMCQEIQEMSEEFSKEEWTKAYEKHRGTVGNELERVSGEVAYLLYMAPAVTIQELVQAVDKVLSTSSLSDAEKRSIRQNIGG